MNVLKHPIFFTYNDPLGLAVTGPTSADKFYNANVIDKTLTHTTENILELHAELQPKVIQMVRVSFQAGYLMLVYSGSRSFDLQLELYNTYLNGGNVAAPPGSSYHNYGLAFDAMIVSRDADRALPNGYEYMQVINDKLDLGLRWGGYFQNVDKPHFQYELFSISELQQNSPEFQEWFALQTTNDQFNITAEDLMQATVIREQRLKKQQFFDKNYGWIMPTITVLSAALILIFTVQLVKYFKSA